MSNYRNTRQNTQGMMALFTSMFPPSVAVPACRRTDATVKSRNPKTLRKAWTPRTKLQQAICQALLATALGSGLTGVLIAYNFRTSIEANLAQWVQVIRG